MKNTEQQASTAPGKALENFTGMSPEAWRMAAERHEALGHPVTALMFRNEAYVLEHPEETWFKVGKSVIRDR